MIPGAQVSIVRLQALRRAGEILGGRHHQPPGDRGPAAPL